MMRLLSAIALLTVPFLGMTQEAVFRNTAAATNYFFPTLFEAGDEVTLAGTNRVVKEISIYYISDITTVQGDEQMVVRFYANDGAGGAPGTLLWTSGNIPVRPRPVNPDRAGWFVQRVVVPNITVPDTFTWTVQFSGVTNVAGDRVGLHLFGPPETGSSADEFWYKDSGGNWQRSMGTGQPPYRSFGATIWAGGFPTTPYQNVADPMDPVFIPNVGFEFGDEITVEGNRSELIGVDIPYFADIASPQNDEVLIFRIYSRNPDGTPGTLLYQSSPQPLQNGEHTITLALPNIATGGDFVWTVDFQGLAQTAGDQAGLIVTHPPSAGNSQIFFYGINPGDVWRTWWFGNPTPPNTNPVANFAISFVGQAPLETVLPESFQMLRGIVFSGGLSDLFYSDDQYLRLRPFIVLNQAEAPIQIVVNGTSPSLSPSELRFRVESRLNINNVNQWIELFNFSTNTYDVLDLSVIGTTEVVKEVSVTTNVSNYVRQTDGLVRARIRYRPVGLVLFYPWDAFLDQTIWLIRP
jgi:hypothetical protein